MKGLLIKDFYILFKQAKYMFILVAIYLLISAFSNGSFVDGFSILFMSMLPITCIALDEKSKWDKLALTMPYSRKDIVKSKYLLGGILISAVSVANVLVSSIARLAITGSFNFSLLLNIMLYMSIGFFFNAILLPFVFKLGVEKGRLVLIILSGIFAGVSVGCSNIIIFFINKISGNVYINYLKIFVFIAILIVWYISMQISVKIYQKKDI